MEEKDIRYTGITQSVSDLDCNDGDLSISHNMINHNGAMRPIILPEPEFVLNEGETLLYIHNTSEYKNYILLSDKKIDNHIHVYRDAIVCQYPTNVKINVVIHEKYPEDDLITVDSIDIPAFTSKMNCVFSNITKVFFAIGVLIDDDIFEYSIGFSDRNYQESDGGYSEQGNMVITRNRLSFFSSKIPDKREYFYNLNDRQIYKINSIGNTLVVLTNQGLVYILYRSGKYEVLGANPPFLSISFRLKGAFDNAKTFTVNFNNKTKCYYETNDPFNPFLDRIQLDNPITADTIYANINPHANGLPNSGLFQYDFMIRYAYRLYDGSLFMSSVPIYINAGNGTPYFLRISSAHSYISDDGTDEVGKYKMIRYIGIDMYSLRSRLYFQINNADEIIREREKWKDLIKEIVFFVTPPLQYMDQSYQPGFTDTISGFNVETDGKRFSSRATLSLGKRVEGQEIYSTVDLPSGIKFKPGQRIIQLRIKPNEAGLSYAFRHIASIDWNSPLIKSGEQVLNIESGVLANLDNREQMEGDFDVSQVLVPRDLFIYNGRLNLINVFSIPFEYPLEACVIYTNARSEQTVLDPFNYYLELYIFKAYVLIESSDANIMIVETSSLSMNSLGRYFFYPDPKAFRVIVERTDVNGKTSYSSSVMKEHELLNGAFTGDLSNDFVDDFDTSILKSTIRGIRYPNKIYTSKENNPFIFPSEGINTIGVGEIVGVSSITKALSQGQFGQFPLLVFATDGIWAMEVSNTGLYSAKQPISRDICSNAGSITQIDGAVIFVSDKGVMVVDGSTVETISTELDGNSFQPLEISKLSDILEKEAMKKELGDIVPVKDFMSNSLVSYDYPNGRLIFIHPEKQYAYVYSLYSKTWATITSEFNSIVTDYPNSYIQSRSGNVIKNSTKIDWNDKRMIKCMLLSRPLKLDGDMYKTINYIINRGNLLPNKMAIVLFASIDGITYFPIGSAKGNRLSSLQGSAFRYFRVLTVGDMSMKESLSVTSLYYTPKWRNKPR